jgi:elongation factor 1-alpha
VYVPADAVLCIPMVCLAAAGTFEQSMCASSPVRQSLLMAHALGIQQVVVTISQLDALSEPFSETRYSECCASMAMLLKRVGFDATRVTYVPTSGLRGDNLMATSPAMSWCA